MFDDELTQDIPAEALAACKSFSPNPYIVEPSMRVLRHSYGGKLIEKLLAIRQPSEPEHIFRYRIANFRHSTKSYFDKVLYILSKIRHAKEFVISYIPEKDDPMFGIDDTLEDYCTQNFPIDDNIENWLFGDALYALLTEPNGVIGIIPEHIDEEVEGEFFRPRPIIYEAKRVAWTNGKEFLLYTGDFELVNTGTQYDRLISDPKNDTPVNWEWVPKLRKNERPQFIFYGKNSIYSILGGSFVSVQKLLQHNFGEATAFIIGGIKEEVNAKRYRSIIDGAIDWWDEVIVMESDLQGAIKQHVYPEKAVYLQDTCKDCHGSGTIIMKDGSRTGCNTCNGTGLAINSVYATHWVRPTRNELGETPVPFPPVAYISKDLGSVGELRAQIDRAVRAAYAALNMENVLLSPVEQSGIAKAYDRQEINSFIGAVAQHLIRKILNPTFWYIVLYRYKYNNPEISVGVLNELTPKVTIPKFFDILPPDFIASELQMQKSAGMSQNIIAATEYEYQMKRFVGNVEARRRYELTRLADPLPAYSLSEKESIRMSGACTLEDYVLSVNLDRYITMAENEDYTFWDDSVTYSERVERIREIAKREIAKVKKDQPEVLVPSESPLPEQELQGQGISPNTLME